MSMDELPTRVANLRAVVEEHMPDGPVIEQFAQIICDGCATTVEVDVQTAEPSRSLDGWSRSDGRDWCQTCTQRREKGMVVT